MCLTNGLVPLITTQPTNQIVMAGGSATFAVTAAGTPPLSYQWQYYGTNLTDNGRISGANTSQLTIANVQLSNAGNYQVIVTNAYGTTNSIVASLTVTNTGTCASPPSGLVAWWRAEGNGQDSAGTNHGTLVNGATFAPGEVGQTSALTVWMTGSRFLKPPVLI